MTSDTDNNDNNNDDDDGDEENDDNDNDENLVSCVMVKQAPSHPTSPPEGKGPTDLCHWISIIIIIIIIILLLSFFCVFYLYYRIGDSRGLAPQSHRSSFFPCVRAVLWQIMVILIIFNNYLHLWRCLLEEQLLWMAATLNDNNNIANSTSQNSSSIFRFRPSSQLWHPSFSPL